MATLNEKLSILGKRALDQSEYTDFPDSQNKKRQRVNHEEDVTSSNDNETNTNTVTDDDQQYSDSNMQMSTINAQGILNQLLDDLDEALEVSIGGVAEHIPSMPLLHVSGIGHIPVPIMHMAVGPLRRKMNNNTLNPHHFECKNRKFNESVQELAQSVAKAMGADYENVVAVPYKLILYEPGIHFRERRDTEKVQGMLGTLVVQLPSIYTMESGMPVMRVEHLEHQFDYHFGANMKGDAPLSATNIFYAANYVGLKQTVNPISSGNRLMLTYNLILSKGEVPQIPDYRNLRGEMQSVFKQWNDSTVPLVFGLEHYYNAETVSCHGIDALKGMFVP